MTRGKWWDLVEKTSMTPKWGFFPQNQHECYSVNSKPQMNNTLTFENRFVVAGECLGHDLFPKSKETKQVKCPPWKRLFKSSQTKKSASLLLGMPSSNTVAPHHDGRFLSTWTTQQKNEGLLRFLTPIGSMYDEYIPTWMVDFYGKLVCKQNHTWSIWVTNTVKYRLRKFWAMLLLDAKLQRKTQDGPY